MHDALDRVSHVNVRESCIADVGNVTMIFVHRLAVDNDTCLQREQTCDMVMGDIIDSAE